MKYTSKFVTSICSLVLLGSSVSAFAAAAQKFNITVYNGDNAEFYLTYNSNPNSYPNDAPASTIYRHTSDNFMFEMVSPSATFSTAEDFYGPTLIYSNTQTSTANSYSCTFQFTGDDTKGCVVVNAEPSAYARKMLPYSLCGAGVPVYHPETATCDIEFYIY